MSFADFFRGRRVLITGHTGFKGAWLSQWLVQLGADVHGVALPPGTTPALFHALNLTAQMDHHELDVRDADGLGRLIKIIAPEIVFHLAAQPLVRASYRDPKATWDINVGGTVNLLEAVRATASVQACVVVTSDKCYENREQLWGYREHDAMGGHDPYSASKGAAELVVASYRRSFFHRSGCRLASARAGNVIGGGDWSPDRIVCDFIASMVAGRCLELRNPQAVRPWQHVLEPLSGYLHLAQRLCASDGATFADGWNFGPADANVATVEHLARALVSAWGSGEVVINQRADQPHEAGLLTLDCRKAAHLLNWRGVWTIEEAVAQTVAWYQTHHHGGNLAELTARQIATYTTAAAQLGLSWASALTTRHAPAA